MDLRKQKSRQKIIDAFINMRAYIPLERLTVKGLCAKAGINKSTFYVHYRDVYDLSEQLENELVEGIIASINHPQAVLDDTNLFTHELFTAYKEKNNMIKILFSGGRSSRLPQMVENSIKKLIFSLRPEYRNDTEKNVELSYRIYGGYYAYIENLDYGEEMVIRVISKMAAANVFQNK
ncbi:MAG: TetR/AcrR family transcriptional regulator [Lachnospiraceae bacterium]